MQLSLSRVGVTGVEKVIRIGEPGAEQLLPRRARVLRRPRTRAEGRAHVALRGGRQRGDRRGRLSSGSALRAEAARAADRRARPRAPRSAPRRGHDHGALPGAQAGAGQRHHDAGDVHALRLGGRQRARHAATRRRHCAGDDRLPVRAGAGRRNARASGSARDGFTTTRSSSILAAVPIATHNQRGLGTLYIGSRRGRRTRRRGADLLAIVEGSMSSEIYELMKRSDEGSVVEKAHRRPRFVEDCVREVIRGVIERFGEPGRRDLRHGPPGEPRDDPPAQRRSPSASACSASCAREIVTGEHLMHHTSMREWLDAGGR